MDAGEYRRKFRVLDQMLSMHGDLRDRYRLLSKAMTLIIMAASIAGVSLALSAGEENVTIAGIHAEGYVWLAVLAAVTFFLTIVELVVEWRRRAWGHDDAAKRLGELKAKFRRARIDDSVLDTRGVDLDQEYDNTMAAIVEIPNKHFVRLKARHRRKIAMSKLLDDHLGVPRPYLRWVLFRNGLENLRTSAAGGVLEPSPPASEEGEKPGNDGSESQEPSGVGSPSEETRE